MRIDSGDAWPSRFCSASSRIPPSQLVGSGRVPQRVRRLVWAADAEAVQPTGEPASNGLVAQRLAPAGTGAADKEHERAAGVERALVQHVAIECVQRARLAQIHPPAVPGLRAGGPPGATTPPARDAPT